MSGRRVVVADAVVAAPGITHFTMIPEWVERCLPSDCWSHTCTPVNFDELRGKRVLIVGGHQSAFEWAALLAEEGTEEVHVVHRHDPPALEPADWSFTDELM
jgi:cation diffusion facilitator CzcD-associated flavoprotein CzcO